MTDIVTEINTIGDLIAPVSAFDRLYKQSLPKEYVANTVGIRWQGDRDVPMTNVIYGIGRIYQIIYFGNSEVNCIQQADKIRGAIDNAIKVKLRDSDGYMTLESFNYSAPFKTETDGVYAIVGILSATVYVERPQKQYEKVATVDAGLNGDRIVITQDTVEYTENGGGN